MRKNFYPQEKKEFVCLHCRQTNNDQGPSPRNHCKHCLYSLHVDDVLPGDRQSVCHELMAPKRLEYSGKKGYSIFHECTGCPKISKNKSAPDDNQDILITLASHAA